MNESSSTERRWRLDSAAGADNGPVNGALVAMHARIADLLDDVTVAAVDPDREPGRETVAEDLAVKDLVAEDRAAQVAPTQEPAANGFGAGDDTGASPVQDVAVAPPIAEQLPAADQPEKVAPAPVVPAEPDVESVLPRPQRPQAPSPNQAINIKGRNDGIAVEIGKGAWPDILSALAERLEQSASFFRQSKVALDVGPRPVVEDELARLLKLLEEHAMTLAVVRTGSERTFESALALGLTATLESSDGVAMADASPAASNQTSDSYFVYRGYLRSGHRLRRTEHVLIIGDVNPGAEVISSGDVLVWGRLRGVVHAGAGGSQRAIVAALDLEPTQLRIANLTAIGPDPKPGQPGRFFWRRSQNKRPEVARIVNDEITLEEWDATRPGGLVSLRRGGR
ncbi:MAG: septum site-determining protein MinC [Caldilineaceae bacterium]|nr:septum site-determining protein MinC [Caldilineaceae bacterium]